MSTPKFPELFPPAIGNEEESMLLTGVDAYNLGDPIEFVSAFGDYLPAGIKKTEGWRRFMQNGGLMYDGGASGEDEESFTSSVNLERATPECATPAEVATYVHANEKLYIAMLKNYVTRRAKAGYPEMARAQRRTVDAYGNSRACHDSIEAKRPDWLADFSQNEPASAVLLTFLQTRSFVTGAGYVSQQGAHFAQKAETLTALNEYGFVSSAYRNASEKDTGARFEIRCSDINISPWAIQTRVGGAAMLFTLLQTPLVNQLANYVPTDLTDTAHLANFRRFNKAEFDPAGHLKFTPDIVRALDFQERTFELIDEELGNFVELPSEYQQLLAEIRYYCKDFRKVLHGEVELSYLADRSDMAAKLSHVVELQQKARTYRKIGDFVTMAADLRYDNITVTLDSYGQPKVDYGYGFKQRDAGGFRLTPNEHDVDRAMYYPPTTTRANTRGTLIRRGDVDECEWASVKHKDLDNPIRLNEVILSTPVTVIPGKGN